MGSRSFKVNFGLLYVGKWSVNRFFSYYFSDDHFGHWREKQRREGMENICKRFLSSTNEQKQLCLEGRHSEKQLKLIVGIFHCYLN